MGASGPVGAARVTGIDPAAVATARAVDAGVAALLAALVALVAIEVLARAAVASWRRFYDRVPHPGARLAADALVPRLFASRANPVASLFAVLADAFGVDLRGTYALTVARRALGPVLLGLALVAWSATALVTVPFDRVGVAERFGVRSATPLAPGPHLLPPWPFGRVELVATETVRSVDLGYRGARAEADRLWTVAHADEEYTLLLGDGLELVLINARLEYRVSDPVAFVYGVQNPRATLAALAERELTRATVDRRLEDVLSENIDRFGAEVAAAVQAAADACGLGVELLGLVVQGLHPPLAVAEDYQAVVAAQVEQDRQAAQAEGYAERERLAAEGRVASTVSAARADAAGRLARARGEAAAFGALRAASAAAPGLFRMTAYLAALERALDGRPYHVVDRRIEADGGAIWLLE
jgi:regulator of protease activity HflC (stomatin/prohibitin superfamily)